MSTREKIVVFLFIVAAIVLRVLFLPQMEFKSDERENLAFLLQVGQLPFDPLAGLAAHSGIRHPSGFAYLLHWITPNIQNPLSVVRTIAGLNILVLTLSLWLVRRQPSAVLAIGLCAVNSVLVTASRKIWPPDLVAPWVILSLASLLLALPCAADKTKKDRPFFAALSGLVITLSGQMYLIGLFYAAVAGAAMLVWTLLTRRWRIGLCYCAGALVGLFAYGPYVHALLTDPQAFGPSSLPPARSYQQFMTALGADLLIPTPFSLYALYLRPIGGWMKAHAADPFLVLLFAWIWLAILSGSLIFWSALVRIGRRFRDSLRDPVVAIGLALLFAMPFAIYLTRMGSHLHYWLGVIPFSAYLLSWSVFSAGEDTSAPPSTRCRFCLSPRLLKRTTWFFCIASFFVSLHFLLLVNRYRGLPGEYGPSYDSQVESRSTR